MDRPPSAPDTPAESVSRAQKFTTWWESLAVRRQFAYGYLASLVLLLVIHLGGIATGLFPNLPVWLGVAYAVGEAILFAGIIVFATRTEIMRKARENEARLRAQRSLDATTSDPAELPTSPDQHP